MQSRALLLSLALVVVARAAVDFKRDVKPVLSNNCYHCHGPDSGNRMAGLRLDQKEGLFGTTRQGIVVVPGKAADSLLYRRISQQKPALRMPPPYSHKSLTDSEVETIRLWIDQGAEWKEHWSFSVPVRSAIPSVSNPSWVRNPIDNFVLARLDREKLIPAVEADKARLLRRLSFDLTGLPPAPEDLEKFSNDSKAGAYERMVDHYLDSKQWGEHRARYWLDVARYGDTHGLHADNYREIWQYRDWVVRAFNANMPFDEFTVEQLAGDLLPSPTLDQKIATGFHRCNVTTNEGGVIPEEVQAMYVKDRVDTTAAAWMGLTLGCATCHDHKYDPLAQKDFYRMAAFFNNVAEPPLDGNIPEHDPVLIIPAPADRSRLADLLPRVEAARQRLDEVTSTLKPLDLSKVSTEDRAALTQRRLAVEATGGPASGTLSFNKPFTLHVRFKDVDVARALLVSYADSQFRMEVALESMFPVVRVQLTGAPNQLAVRGNTARLSPRSKQEITVVYDGSGHAEGFTLYAAGRSIPIARVDPLPLANGSGWVFGKEFDVRTTLYGRGLSPLEVLQSTEELDGKTRALSDRLSSSTDALSRFTEMESLESALRPIRYRGEVTLVMKEKPSPPVAHVLRRGQYDQPGEEVTPATPATLPPMLPEWPKNRLGLARWLVDPGNPLTARVVVNRFWQEVFGVGIVKTSEDFGSTGQPPVNPELLDWLAVEFHEFGWDVKRLFRLMVTSAAYRQAAVADPAKLERDPENRLLSRGPRFRMDAEMIRDTALVASGLLDLSMGGPPVKPLQPEGIWESVAVPFSNTRFYSADSGAALTRRSLYTILKRSAPPPAMEILNAPTRETCTVRRERTNTPLQALVTLNDSQLFNAAQRLAANAMEDVASDQGRLDYMSTRLLSRRLTGDEQVSVFITRERLLKYYRAHLDEAARISGVGKPEAAAWIMVASQLLNLDEVLTK
jgi:Protein of unknown function (DUF1553)/Protein of unknown function (DUF1549)/Planctomycete cytochrome C